MGRIAFVVTICLSTAVGATAQPVAPVLPAPAPADAYFEFMLSRRLEGQGDVPGALAALQRAIALDSSSAELHAELAGVYARQNNGPASVAAAERALVLNPANVDAHRMLGLVYAAWAEGNAPVPGGRQAGELRSLAIDHLSKILDTPLMATDLNLQLTLARLHMRAGQPGRALPVLENLVAQAPFAAEPYTLLADAQVALGQLDNAIGSLTAAAELNPRHYGALAELFERQRRWEDAADAYQAALSNARGNSTRDLRLRYAATLLNLDDPQRLTAARDVLKDYLMTAPQDARALLLLATASLRLGELPVAEEIARTLHAQDPANLQALHTLSAALVAQRKYREVVALLTPLAEDATGRAKGRMGDAALLLTQLAHAHSSLGDEERAIAVLTTAVARDPKSSAALNSLGYTLAERGERLPDAIGYIERALTIEPDNASYIDSLGWALFKQGKFSEAEVQLRKAAAALPEQSVIQDHHGDALARLGRYPEAATAWELALKGDGDDIDRAALQKKIRDARTRKQ